MNKKLIPLIGIGALVGSSACLLAKKLRMKKKASWDIDFEDDTLLADEFRIDDEPVRPGYIFESDLHDALMSLFRAYSDWEIMGCGVFHNCTADDLREYWADLMTALLLPVLNDGWETSPRLEAYGDKTKALVEHHGDLFTEPAFILVNDLVDYIDDPSWSVEHNVQLWITDSGYLAIVHMFGVLNGSEYVGYYDFDYSVNEFSRVPWRFEKLLSKLFRLVENRHAW